MADIEKMILLPTERELILKLAENDMNMLLTRRLYQEDIKQKAEKYNINTRTGDETGLLKAFIDGFTRTEIMDKLDSEDNCLPIFRRNILLRRNIMLRYDVMPSEEAKEKFSSYKSVINDLVKQRKKYVRSELINIDKAELNIYNKESETDYNKDFAFGSNTVKGFGEKSNLNFDGYVFQILSSLPSEEQIKKFPSKLIDLQRELDSLNMKPYNPTLAAEMSVKILNTIREYNN